MVNRYELYFGDCLDVLPSLPANSVDLVLCDPPYAITNNIWDKIIDLPKLWVELLRVGKDSTAYVFTSAEPYTSKLVMSNLKMFKYDMVWVKSVASGQLNVNIMPLRLHEQVLVFYKKPPTYNEFITEGEPYKIKRKSEQYESNYGEQKDHESINDGIRRGNSIIQISNPRIKNGHPTQKPIKLMNRLVSMYSNENDVVLDFSMGSGTTGESALSLNRKFVGIELDAKYYKNCEKRLNMFNLVM